LQTQSPHSLAAAMATVTPLTSSPLRGHRLYAKSQPRRFAALLPRRPPPIPRLYCAPEGEVSAAPAPDPPAAEAPEQEEFTLLAVNRSDFNEVIMIIDSPAAEGCGSARWWGCCQDIQGIDGLVDLQNGPSPHRLPMTMSCFKTKDRQATGRRHPSSFNRTSYGCFSLFLL
jgi:hypothetical protein